LKGNPGVLTNAPSLEWQLKNLSNYISITPVNTINKDELTNNFTLGGPWQGSGFVGLPASLTLPDRFVRTAMMANYAYQIENSFEAIPLFHILNTVDIPWGTPCFRRSK